MAKFGLIGHPISHSKSPALFRAAYPQSLHSYELIEGDNLKYAINTFLKGGYRGINVTSPFKDDVMHYISLPDRVSSILGSANVVIKDKESSLEKPLLHSYNTDYYGVRNAFLEFAEERVGCKEELATEVKLMKNVLVVGAGGAGKAAALAMRDMGYKVALANRSAGKVAKFADRIDVEYISLESIAPYVENADIIIYALSFMLEGFNKFDFSRKILFEANYAKPVLSSERGIECSAYIDGKKWLYHQAIPAFELFTEEMPNKVLMRDVIGLL